MSFTAEIGSKGRSVGRRQEDRAMRGGQWSADRERRRPVLQTGAAAQSVVIARFSTTPQRPVTANVAEVYAQVVRPKTPKELRKEEFMREAELAHQEAQKAWVFERRTGQKPRATDIEYAEIIDD